MVRALSTGRTLEVRGCEITASELHGRWVIEARCATCARNEETCALRRRGGLARALAAECRAALADLSASSSSLRALALRALAGSPEPSARVEAARDRCCPAEVLEVLGTDWWWEVRAAVATNPARPVATAISLARDPTLWVRRSLAESSDVDRAVLEILAGDTDFGVRDAVAEHPDCPPELLARLATDEVFEIRRSVAKRRDTPVPVLEALAGDDEHWVRFFVACNPATPAELRRQLEHDSRPSVRVLAKHPRARREGARLSGPARRS